MVSLEHPLGVMVARRKALLSLTSDRSNCGLSSIRVSTTPGVSQCACSESNEWRLSLWFELDQGVHDTRVSKRRRVAELVVISARNLP